MKTVKELIDTLCPNGVPYRTIGELCHISRGVVMSKDYIRENEGEYPVYSSQTENNGELGRINTFMFDGEYLTWTTDGANAGSVFYREGKFSVTNVCGLLKVVDSSINIKFLYYALQIATKPYVSKGMGNAKLMSNVMSTVLVPVPPIEVQSEIVSILDDLTRCTNELTDSLNKKLLDRKEQFIYYRDYLFEKVEGKKGKLIDFLSQPITDGPHTTPIYYNEGVPFVSAAAVFDGRVHLSKAQGFISKEFDLECSKKYKPKKHDVYMVKSGSTTGKVGYVDFDDDFNIWSPLAAMRTNNPITSRYIYHLLQTSFIQKMVLERMSHGSQPNLSMRVLEQFDVIIPDISRQEEIVKIMDRYEIVASDILNTIKMKIASISKQYEYYRNKLLTFKELKD